MMLFGLQKTTLIDFPGNIACTVFAYGCNFRCPFCHNPELVVKKASDQFLSREDIIEFLKTRIEVLTGVVFSGGEPLMNVDIIDMIKEVKQLGFKIKVDTNGSFPETINKLMDASLVDYWAMDIKNSADKYCKMIGREIVDIMTNVKASIDLIMNSGVDYEFRTTVIPGSHTEKDIEEIAKMICGAKLFSIQNFRNGELLDPDFTVNTGFGAAQLEDFSKVMRKYVEKVDIKYN